MRSNLVLFILVGSLTTLACNREETANPSDATPTTEEPAPAEEPGVAEESTVADAELGAVCQHMLDLTIADLGDTMTLTPEQQQETMTACVTDLDSKRASMPSEEFRKKVDCVSQATSLEQVVACG
jgi:hypothetical protein